MYCYSGLEVPTQCYPRIGKYRQTNRRWPKPKRVEMLPIVIIKKCRFFNLYMAAEIDWYFQVDHIIFGKDSADVF